MFASFFFSLGLNCDAANMAIKSAIANFCEVSHSLPHIAEVRSHTTANLQPHVNGFPIFIMTSTALSRVTPKQWTVDDIHPQVRPSIANGRTLSVDNVIRVQKCAAQDPHGHEGLRGSCVGDITTITVSVPHTISESYIFISYPKAIIFVKIHGCEGKSGQVHVEKKK